MKSNRLFLLNQLIVRDFKVKYKRSVLGVFWSFLNPLLLTLVQYIVFSNFFRFEIENYVVYLLCGIVIFNYFSDGITQGIFSIVSNASLLKKVKLPKMIFPLSKILSCGINFVISLVPFTIFVLFNDCSIGWHWLALLIDVFFLVLFLLGMTLALSALMVFFRDIQFLWSVVSMLWMYATPIFYPAVILPDWMQTVEKFNPMYQFINYFRVVIIEARIPDINTFIGVIGSGLFFFGVGYLIFHLCEDKFVTSL